MVHGAEKIISWWFLGFCLKKIHAYICKIHVHIYRSTRLVVLYCTEKQMSFLVYVWVGWFAFADKKIDPLGRFPIKQNKSCCFLHFFRWKVK